MLGNRGRTVYSWLVSKRPRPAASSGRDGARALRPQTITLEARNALLIDRCARRQSTWPKWASPAAGCLGDGGDYTKHIQSACLWRRSPVVRSRCRFPVVRSRSAACPSSAAALAPLWPSPPHLHSGPPSPAANLTVAGSAVAWETRPSREAQTALQGRLAPLRPLSGLPSSPPHRWQLLQSAGCPRHRPIPQRLSPRFDKAFVAMPTWDKR